jgi:hypothetical protein
LLQLVRLFVAVVKLKINKVSSIHRHLSNIDCLSVNTSCLVCFICTINGRSKNKRKEAY